MAGPSNHPSSSQTPTADLASQILHSPKHDLKFLISKHAKYKERSHTTFHNDHKFALASTPPRSLTTILIGDSRLERFAWYAPDSRMNKLDRSFNAGVGGDKIENVLYRIEQGLLTALEDQEVRLWVVSVGTNDLRPKGRGGLRGAEVEALIVLIVALLRTAGAVGKVLVTELSYRTDISDEIVDTVNGQLKRVIRDLNEASGCERVLWHGLPGLRKEEHLLDHVHFNEEGYHVWDGKLYADVHDILSPL